MRIFSMMRDATLDRCLFGAVFALGLATRAAAQDILPDTLNCSLRSPPETAAENDWQIGCRSARQMQDLLLVMPKESDLWEFF